MWRIKNLKKVCSLVFTLSISEWTIMNKIHASLFVVKYVLQILEILQKHIRIAKSCFKFKTALYPFCFVNVLWSFLSYSHCWINCAIMYVLVLIFWTSFCRTNIYSCGLITFTCVWYHICFLNLCYIFTGRKIQIYGSGCPVRISHRRQLVLIQ